MLRACLLKIIITKASLCLLIKGLFLLAYTSFAQDSLYAPYGEVFTPKGDLRFLIICAGFGDADSSQYHDGWFAREELPKFLQKPGAVFYNKFEDFDKYRKDPSVKNLSKLYELMSSKETPLRVVADVYPQRINVHPDSVKRRGWGAVNKEVIKEFYRMDPDFDWGKYDKRMNRPEFRFDNSLSQPDGLPDYVIILYRYHANWKHQPISGMNRWLGEGEGASSLSIGNFKFGDYTISSDGFFSFSNTSQKASAFMGMFKHELGHELISCPHYMGANLTMGKHFYTPAIGWGTTVSDLQLNETINAWERYLLGWITPEFITEGTKKKIKLRDIATTGDAVRIEVPNSGGQYLWLENHQKLSVFDEHNLKGELVGKPVGSSGIPGMDKGIYTYVEDMMANKTDITKRFVYDMSAVNGVVVLNAQGNFDYAKPMKSIQTNDWSICWNNKVYYFDRGKPNPISGLNPFILYRHDFDGDGRIKHSGNFNHGRSEITSIVMENIADTSFLFYGVHGGRNKESKPFRRSAAFENGDELSFMSNPALTNFPVYNAQQDSVLPYYGHGLRLRFKERKGVFTVKVDYNNFTFDNNRLAGDVILTKNEFQVKRRSVVLIDRTGTVNRVKKPFFDYSQLLLLDGASLKLNRKSRLLVKDSSSVIIENARFDLNRKAAVDIGTGSVILLKKGASMNIHSKAEILLKGTLIFQKGSTVNGEEITDDLKISDVQTFKERFN